MNTQCPAPAGRRGFWGYPPGAPRYALHPRLSQAGLSARHSIAAKLNVRNFVSHPPPRHRELFAWHADRPVLGRECSLKCANTRSHPKQSNVREPRENRGRLRHCNGLQTPISHYPASAGREGGSEVRPEVRIPVCLRSSGPAGAGPTSPSKRRMRPARSASAARGSSNAFILRFAGV
jgi:hypothetical protein